MAFNIKDWFEEHTKTDLIYKSTVQTGTGEVFGILNDIDILLKDFSTDPVLKTKIYKISAELLQIALQYFKYLHSDEWKSEDENKISCFSITEQSKGFYKITVAGFLPFKEGVSLRDLLEQINFISSDQIRRLYRIFLKKTKIRQELITELGLVYVYRISGNKLLYRTEKINNSKYFYSIEVLV